MFTADWSFLWIDIWSILFWNLRYLSCTDTRRYIKRICVVVPTKFGHWRWHGGDVVRHGVWLAKSLHLSVVCILYYSGDRGICCDRLSEKTVGIAVYSVFWIDTYGNEFMKHIWKKQISGFITIEYSLLLPSILLLYTCLVGIAFYQYNQCILHTNVYLLGSEGTALYQTDAEDKLQALQQREESLYHSKYLLVENLQTRYEIKGNELKIIGTGNMFPISIGNKKRVWNLYAACSVTATDPMDTLRLCKTMITWMQKKQDQES